ncbi:MAG: D-inositol-3-phosphate glycosyltransferase [Methyloprofundus sp.]|nr:MAG: D-inositol-3-phosphate glycosyltransferase [Methyloprofundus sp.]
MKVAIVVPSIHDGGGVPAVAKYLYDILSIKYQCQLVSVSTSLNDSFSIKLFSPSTWGRGIRVDKSLWEGKEVLNVGAFLTEFESQRYMPRIELTELLNQYDVVQIVSGAPAWAYLAKNVQVPVFLQTATLLKEERKKVIEGAKGLRRLYLQFSTFIGGMIEKKALKVIDVVFVENFWMKEYLAEVLGEHKVLMAPPGVDSVLFIPKEHNSNQHIDNKYIVSVGRFNDKRKNIHLLFEAYSLMSNLNDNTPLLFLAGLSGPSEEDWLYADRLNIRENIRFKKDILDDELVTLLQNAEFFVCSSDEEGFGIAMIEALSCGIPVISTRCGGPETFMRHGINGYLVENNNATELAERMNELSINDNLRFKMGLTARKIVEDEFSNNATSRVFLNKYEEIAVNLNTSKEYL